MVQAGGEWTPISGGVSAGSLLSVHANISSRRSCSEDSIPAAFPSPPGNGALGSSPTFPSDLDHSQDSKISDRARI